jgi:protein-tyrosine phosphatase
MIRVLFVCMGNICRSPMAEGVFRELVAQAGVSDQFELDSAGTIGYHAGEPAHRGTRLILEQNGIHYEGRSRQITHQDLTHFDYLIVMDEENFHDVQRLNGQRSANPKLHRLLDFASETPIREVPDPYYSGGFDEVYQLVLAGCQGLLDHIRTEHSLLS